MQRSTIIIALCVLLSVGGAGYHFYSKYQAQVEQERMARETAVKVAVEKEKKAAEELRKLQEKEKEQSRRVAELEAQQRQSGGSSDNVITMAPSKPGTAPGGPPRGGVRPPALVGQGPLPGQPVPPIVAAAEKFIAEARLTSTSLDTSPYAVINRRTFRVGERVDIGPGAVLTIDSIDDGFVIFSGGGYKFKMRLTSLSP